MTEAGPGSPPQPRATIAPPVASPAPAPTTAAGPRWLDGPEQRAWRAYLRGSRLLERALGDDLAPLGMQLPEYELISMLSEAPGQRLRMSQLADLVVQSRSRVTHTAARLEGRGWVTRNPSADDGRGVEIHLTDAGRAVLAEAATVHVASVRRHLVDRLDPVQVRTLGSAMAAVRDALAPGHQELAEGSGGD